MEVTDLNDLLNVRAIKMENTEVTFSESTEGVESSDPLSVIPQFVTETDLGLMQPGAEILQAPLAVFSDTADDDDTMQSSESSEEVVIQLMDIRTPLSKLQSMLERRLGVDLSDYTFWLQDAKMLESHKTLVEQCIKGSGVVQVNIQLKPLERKINILDVLKPDEELVHIPKGEDEDALEEVEEDMSEDPTQMPVLASLSPPASPPPSHAAAVKWVVDNHLHNTSRIKLPDDPAEWSIQHVKIWIQWSVRQFNLKGVKLSDWNISGQRLCKMTNFEFKLKVPLDPGDLFWTHFELLRKCKFIAVVQEESSEQTQDVVKDTQKDVQKEVQSAIRKKKPKVIAVEEADSPLPSPVSNAFSRQPAAGQVQLWQFLLELLTGAEYYDIIRWHGPEGEFILLEPEKVARLWGQRKNKPLMNYEKLSRALRYYYDGDMIAKVSGRRFVYKFVCDLRQLLGYDATELAAKVKQVVDTSLLDHEVSHNS